MNNNTRWISVLIARVAVHLTLGAAFCALVGAALIAAAGASVGWVLDIQGLSPSIGSLMILGAQFGAVFGGVGAVTVGAIAFGVIGFFSPPRQTYLPPKSILLRVLIAMSAAAVGIMGSFYVLMGVLCWARGVSFPTSVGDGTIYILFGAPAVMCCGLIAGAVWGFRQQKAELSSQL